MSRLQSARRRLSLLAGSSLAAASLFALGPVGLVLAPGAAMAADECTPTPPTLGNGPGPVSDDPTLNGPVADNFVCASTITYPTGITYVSEGHLTVSSPFVSGVFLNLGTGALSLTGEGTDNVTLNSEQSISGSQAPFTLAARVSAATASGDITMDIQGVQNISDIAGAGIVASSTNGGAISITSTGEIFGGRRGLVAQTTGAGTITLDLGIIRQPYVPSSTADVVAIDASSGTGAIDIVVDGISAEGLVTRIGVRTSTGGLTTLSGALYGLDYAVQSSGNRVVIEDASITGAVDFSALTGGATIDLDASRQWRAPRTSLFSGGADSVTVGADARLLLEPVWNPAAIEGVYTAMAFGGGADVIDNAGLFAVSSGDRSHLYVEDRDQEATTLITGLETFNNSGVIVLGNLRPNSTIGSTDRSADDILSMPGTDYVSDGGRIVFDVNPNRSQSSCDNANRDTGGDMAADCLALAGGSTSGETLVTVNDLFAGDLGGASVIVLVDVSGGTSQAGDFVLSPDSDGYSAALDAIDKGFFVYPLLYNAATQQHVLVGSPGANALTFPVLAQAAHSLWRTSTGTWLDRQADLRGGIEGGAGSWFRVSTESASRDVIQTVEAAGNTLTFANDFKQDSYAINGGVDLVSTDGFVLGLMAGYAHADVDFEVSSSTGQFDGWTGGAYASYVSEALFVDAAVNFNRLEMDVDIPDLDLFPAGTTLDTKLVSVGAQIEAGWRFQFGSVFAEPLAGVSYVRSTYDDLSIAPDDPARQGVQLEFDDPASLRAGLGGRVGLDQDFGGLRSQFAGSVRVWEELDGESAVAAHNAGADAPLYDEFTGTFTDIALSAALYSPSGAVSGLLNVGGRFGTDYEATTASVAIRVHW